MRTTAGVRITPPQFCFWFGSSKLFWALLSRSTFSDFCPNVQRTEGLTGSSWIAQVGWVTLCWGLGWGRVTSASWFDLCCYSQSIACRFSLFYYTVFSLLWSIYYCLFIDRKFSTLSSVSLLSPTIYPKVCVSSLCKARLFISILGS